MCNADAGKYVYRNVKRLFAIVFVLAALAARAQEIETTTIVVPIVGNIPGIGVRWVTSVELRNNTGAPVEVWMLLPTTAQAQAFNGYLASTVHVAHAHRHRGYRWATQESSFEDMRRMVPQTVGACFQLIEDEFLKAPWVLGERFSVCDAYLLTVADWLEGDGVDPARFPKVHAHRERVRARPAVAAVLGGTFSLSDAGLRFVAGAAGGIAIGLAVGWIVAWIRERTTDIQVSVDEAKALKAAKPDADLVLVDGMNHVMKRAPADPAQNVATYSNPDLPIVPDVPKAIVDLVRRVAR